MSEETPDRSSRFGLILMLVAIGGSAVGVVAWHLISNRGSGLDTSGFDVSSTPDAHPTRYPVASASAGANAQAPTSLGMIKVDPGIQVIASGSSAAAPAKPAGSAKADAAAAFKEAAAKNETAVASYIRRMQAKYPSIGEYGKDWLKHPDLMALRDQYWRDKDPLKFAYGLAKSPGFPQLLKKYAGDPGLRAVLIGAIKEAPPSLMGAMGGVFSNDRVAKDLVGTVAKAMGLPSSLLPMLDGGDAKAPDANNIMAEIMKSPDVRKSLNNQAAPVPLDGDDANKAKEPAAPNGFTPLGGR